MVHRALRHRDVLRLLYGRPGHIGRGAVDATSVRRSGRGFDPIYLLSMARERRDDEFLEHLERSLDGDALDPIRERLKSAAASRVHEYPPEKLRQLLHDAARPARHSRPARETLGILEGLVAARRGDTHELEIPPTFGPDD
jgi:hypothetical protein